MNRRRGPPKDSASGAGITLPVPFLHPPHHAPVPFVARNCSSSVSCGANKGGDSDFESSPPSSKGGWSVPRAVKGPMGTRPESQVESFPLYVFPSNSLLRPSKGKLVRTRRQRSTLAESTLFRRRSPTRRCTCALQRAARASQA